MIFDHKDPRSPNRFLVVVGILEVYHQLQLPPPFPLLAHLAQTLCRANIIEAVH
jgi:hypothetical protein